MFAASYRNTMASARPKPAADPEVYRSIAQARAEKQAEAERVEEEGRQKVAAIIAKYRVIDVSDAKPNCRRLIEETAAKHGMTYRDVISASRAKLIVAVRNEAIRVVADARPDMSLPALGKIFKRDHTTILHSLRKTSAPGKNYRVAKQESGQ